MSSSIDDSERRASALVAGPRRKSWPLFAGQCLLVLAVIVAGGTWFMAHYSLALASGKPCLPGRLFLVEKGAPPDRNDLVAFVTDTRQWPYRPGLKFVKLVVGRPGDQVEIDGACQGMVTGPDYAYAFVLEKPVLDALGKECRDLAGGYAIPPGHYFVMGTLPGSYDSRHWGLVASGQVTGRAWRLF